MPFESGHDRRLSVVIAEDNAGFRQNLATLIAQHKGYRIAGEARDGTEAIAMVSATHPDLVLLDISMPNIGGLAAAFEIRHESPGTKIVFVTVHDKANYFALADMVQVDGYICKYNLKQELPLLLEKVRGTIAAERL